MAGWWVSLAAAGLVPLAAQAVDVPFPSTNVVDAIFDGANAVQAADMDGDGDLDLLGAANFADQIAWWANEDGSGGVWTKHVIDANFADACAVLAADVDGDGDQDALGAAPGTTDSLVWWENVDGAATNWIEHTVATAFDGARGIHADDVDGDGDIDVLGAAVSADDISWWENTNGIGTGWIEHAVDDNFDGANAVFSGDIDGDGDIDILGAADREDTLAWWENLDGVGTAWQMRGVATNFMDACDVVAADVDGDGDLDVLGAAETDDLIAWWENDGGLGTAWNMRVIGPAFDGARKVHPADVDQDGDVDVLGAAAILDRVTWWENVDGQGSNWLEHVVARSFDSARSVIAADVDGDGDTDVAGAAFIDDAVAWWDNRTIHRSAAFPLEAVVATNFGWVTGLHIADIDGNGGADILAAAEDAGELAWWTRVPHSPVIWSQRIVDAAFASPSDVFSADFDRDGDMDVLAASKEPGRIHGWQNVDGEGGSWNEFVVDGAFAGAAAVYAADIDQDGDPDVVGIGAQANELAWWQNLGAAGTNWVKQLISAVLTGATDVAVCDMDGDGDPDVVAVAESGVANGPIEVGWWENAGGSGTNWNERVIDDSFGVPSSVACSDVDGDGDADVVVAASGDGGGLVWWENLDGVWSNTVSHVVSTGAATRMALGDLDRDGDVDLVGASHLHDELRWWENMDGSGTNWFAHPIATGGAFAVCTADLAGDGDLDIVVGSAAMDYIFWWENRGGQVALGTESLAPNLLLQGGTGEVFTIEFTHRGVNTDQDAQLRSLAFLLEQDPGVPLSNHEASNLIADLRFYLDEGTGSFEPALDTLVTNVTELELVGGVQALELADSEPSVQITPGSTNRYFLVAWLREDAGNQVPNRFRVTHLIGATNPIATSVEDVEFDIPLTREGGVDVASTTTVVITETDVAVAKVDDPDPVTASSNLLYTLFVSNSLANSAIGVVVTDTLPAGATFDAAVSDFLCVETAGVVVCDLGTLVAGEDRSITLGVTLGSNVAGVVTNRVTVSTLSVDDVPLNNIAVELTSIPDHDVDGIPDFRDPDDDNDAIPDQWELDHGLNPTNDQDALLDEDGDTFNNLAEYVADTDPLDSNVFFHVEELSVSSPVEIAFEFSDSRLYTLQFLDALRAGAWSNVLGQVRIPGPASGGSLLDTNVVPQRNYRIQVEVD